MSNRPNFIHHRMIYLIRRAQTFRDVLNKLQKFFGFLTNNITVFFSKTTRIHVCTQYRMTEQKAGSLYKAGHHTRFQSQP